MKQCKEDDMSLKKILTEEELEFTNHGPAVSMLFGSLIED